MRLRKLAGLMVGAVTAGVVSLPALAGPAQAAPSTETATQALSCTFGSFTIDYAADLTASVDGTAITGTLAEQFTPGMPAFVTVSKMKMDLATTIDGEAVTLTGTDTYSPARAGNTSFDIPALSGTRVGTADPEDVAITGATITLTAMGNDNTVPCVAVEPEPTELTATQALTCTFGSFSINYNADLAATVDGTAVTGVLAEQFTPGMPAFVTVSKLKMDLATTIDGEAVTLTGTDTYSPARPGNGSFAIPALSGARTGTATPEELAITGATITLTAMGSDSTVPCAIAEEPEPTELTATQALSCAYQSFTINYAADLTASVDGTAVTGVLAEAFTPGMPAFVTVSKLKIDLATTIDGEAVTLTGSEDYSPARPGNSSFTFAGLAGERTGTAAPEELAITGATITMTAMGSDNTIPCVIAEPEPTELAATQALSCAYQSFTINYAADLTASVDGTAVTGVLAEAFTPGMPAFVTVSKLKIDLATTIDGEAVTLTGSEDYSPARPGNSSFTFADLAGERNGTTAPEELAITGATITMTAMGSDNTIPCVLAAPATETTTTLAATSPTPGAVSLAATVAPAAAGKVEFFEGENKVGEQATAAGAATLNLTGVTAGQHGYRAVFVPTDAVAFEGSSSTVQNVTVAAVPAVATATALNGSSPAAAQVALSATVTPAAAGKVEFFEGAAKVGEKAVASGAAAVALTGVSAGEHSYTATFVPTNPAAFVGSTSTVVKVTVAAAPKPGPTAACIKAQGDVKTTAAAVKKADAKVKSTKNAVKKATKAAKKAKGKKAKAAKAKLKKAKKAASSAAKAAKSAKAKNTAATNAVKANC